MQYHELKQRLKNMEAPAPSEGAEERALDAAMQAFSLHQEKKRKGFTKERRLISTTATVWEQLIGRLSMQKSYILAGSATAFLLALAVTTTHYSDIMGGKLPASNIVAATPLSAPEAAIDKKSEAVLPAINAAPAPSAPAAPPPPPVPMAQVDMATNNLSSVLQAVHENSSAKSTGQIMAEKRIARAYNGAVAYPAMPMAQLQPADNDKFENFTPNAVKMVKEEPVSTFSIDVNSSSYSFVRRMLNSGVLPQKDAVRVEEMINYFPYNYPVPESSEQPFKPTITVVPTPWNPNTKLVHIGIKGHDITPAEKPRSNLVFLIDVSGSMMVPDRLPLVKNALRMLVDQLQPEDTVGIVVYAGHVGTVLEPTRIAEKEKILAVLDQLEAGGSTAGGQGIQQAYALAEAHFDKHAVNRVILSTDGDFNVGITDPKQLVDFIDHKRETGIYLSLLGVGHDNYNDALVQKMAQHGNGNAAYIDNLNEARKVLVEEASSTLFTIAKDVKIQVEFNPDTVSEYRLIGYESRLLNREDFNNDKVDAGDIGSGHAVTAIYEITPATSKAKQVDALRYQKEAPAAEKKTDGAHGNEYAFLKIRYKLPNEEESRLITTPITPALEVKTIAQASDDTRFATAVAAFGQLLKSDTHIDHYSYDDVLALAEPARGKDIFGYRAEFLNLVRLAKTEQGGHPVSAPIGVDY